MAIINTDLPEDVSLIRSTVQVKLTSNLQVEASAFDHVLIAVAGDPTAGQTLELSYSDVSETFTVQNVADDSGNTLSRQNAMALAEYADQLVVEFNRNYLILINFVVSRETTGGVEYVKIYPRKGGSTWTVADNLANLTATIQSFTNPNAPDNPGVLLLVEVYDQENAAYNDPLPHVLPILSNNEQVIFDIQKDFDLRHFLPPASTIGMGGDYIMACTDNWTKYRLRWAEQEGRPAVVNGLDEDQERFAIYGGNAFLLQYSDFWTFFKNNRRFLTSQPNTKTITVEQPEYLYWVGRTTSDDVFVRVTATQRSGSITTYDRGGITVLYGEVICIKAGFKQLNLPELVDDPIVSYQVGVYYSSNDQAISELFTYKIDGTCGEFTRFYLFGNSLGGCDTVRATGKFITNLEIATQQASRIVTEEVIEEGRGQDFDYNRRLRAVYEGSVGYKNYEYILYLQDLLQSPEVWMVDVSRQLYSPIQVDAGNIRLAKDGEDLYSLSFRYRHAWEDNSLGVTGESRRVIGSSSRTLTRDTP